MCPEVCKQLDGAAFPSSALCVISPVLFCSYGSPVMVLQPDSCGFCDLARLYTFVAVPVSEAKGQEEEDKNV